MINEKQVIPSSIISGYKQSTTCHDSPSKLHERHTESIKRDTILLDLTNNDVLPALDYALSILEAEETSVVNHDSSSPPPSPTSPTSSVFTSSSPPRYVVLPDSWRRHSTRPPRAHSPTTSHARHPTVATYPLDPQDFAHVFSRTRSGSDPPCPQSVPPSPSIPFPTSTPSPSGIRVPLLQRKPRFNAETISVDMRDPFIFGNSSNLTLVRSLSALDCRRECASYESTTSISTIESSWSTFLLRRPVLRTPSKFFSSPRKSRIGSALIRNGSITASLKKPLNPV